MDEAQVSLIITTLNESNTVEYLLHALARQTHLLQEVIIVDGGSDDDTISIIKKWKQKFKPPFQLKIKQLQQANRSQGRNWGISEAKNNLIAITDAGCIPQPSWLEELVKKYQETQADIIGGYFFGLPAVPFEQAVTAYTLEMPDRINPKKFMPTTRSVLLTKAAWEKTGKFDEKLSLNEDFVFFNKAKQKGSKFAFAREALVGWLPRKNLKQFFKMVFKFAQGDTYAGIIRKRVLFLFARYTIALAFLLYLIFIYQAALSKILLAYGFGLLIYLLWAVSKNFRYAKQGWYWLPVLQVTADICAMTGSLLGWLRRLCGRLSRS